MTAMLTAALVVLSVYLHRCSSQPCDEDNGWNYVNGSCFKMFMDRSSWEQARQECEVVNAELATVFTSEEHTAFFKTAREQNTSVWVGLKTQEISGQMQLSWINGSVLNPEGNVTFWGDNQPGDLKNDTCLVIDGVEPPQDASWRMDNCNEMHSFLCEKPQGSCEVGWLSHLGTCFRMFHRKNSWNSSRSFCHQIDAQLVKISSSTDQQFLQSYLQEFSDEGVRSFWIGIGAGMNNSGPLLWTDGSSIDYSFWAQVSESPDTPGMENCAYIDTSDVDGRWQITTDCLHARAFVCTIPINTPVRPIIWDSDSSLCHRGWIAHGGSCYHFSTKQKSWSSAQAACLSHHADLVVIRGSDDQSFIKSQIHGTDYWIGLTDNSREGRWMWVDQSEATYTNWESHAFDVQNADEDCAGVIGTRGHSKSGMWKDYICDRKMHYICQKPASQRNQSSTTTRAAPKYFTASTPVVSQKCGAHWEERPNSDYCYQFHARPANHRDAESTCQHNNGTLVSIRDSAEQNFLAGRRLWLSTDSIWIGATDSSMEDGWSWSDRTPFAYINWNPGKPSNSDYRQDCAAMMRDNSRWSDYICTLEKSFVCKKTADTIISTVPTAVSTFSPRNVYGCAPGWIKYNDHCYSIRDERDTWDGARSQCRADGAELTSISSEYENDFLASHLPRASLLSVWIGLSNSRRPQTFEWLDDTTVQFTNWGIRQPVMSVLRSCVLLSATKWSTASCDSQLSYVCKKQISVLSRTSLSPFQEGCPANTLAYEAYCYQFMDTLRLNWIKAESTCSNQLQGHLATINDVHVHLALASELQPRTAVSHYWVGLSDVKTPGMYNWSSGESLRYAAWSPLYTGNRQNSCVGIKTSAVAGQWEKLDCQSTRPFVCQFPRKGFTTTITTVAPTTEIPCLDGWTGFRDRCYLPYAQAKKTWDEARAICQGYGADLASIPDKFVNDFVSDLFLPGATSLRYSDILEEAFWIGIRRIGYSTFKWSDGTPFIYAAWMSGNPNIPDYSSVCGEYNQRRKEWKSRYCSAAKPFLCSIARGRQMTTTLQPLIDISIMCNEDGWVYNGGYCYYISSNFFSSKKTWFQARRFCQTQGADLVSILSANDNAFLEKLAGTKFTYVQKVWTGLHRINIDAFEWSDRSPLIYQNWDSGEPNEFAGAEKCTCLYSTNGRWNDDSCQLGMHYICKKANGTKPLAPVPTPTISGGCPPGFSEIGNKCYTVGGVNQYQGGSNWADAIFACSNMSSRNKVFLASITSPQEQAFVLTLLENSARNAFIGLSNLHSDLTFAWHSGEEVTLTYWSGTPNRMLKHCVVIQVDEVNFGKWKDVECNGTYAYVCQTLKDPTYPSEEPPGSGCRSDYLRYRDSCYHTYTRASPWFEAQKICLNDGGNLVSIRDVHELSKVHVFTYLKSASRPVWIGLYYNKTATQYNWVDNVPVTFTKWGRGQPSLHHSGSCVSMADGVWSDVSCSHAKQFVCKTPVDNPSYTILPDFLADVGICEDPEDTSFQDYCYYANPHDIVSWSDANIKCRDRKMELVSIHSQEEQNFVVNLTKKLWKQFLGYRDDEVQVNQYWQRDDDGHPPEYDEFNQYWQRDDGGHPPKYDEFNQYWQRDDDGHPPKYDPIHQLQKLTDFLEGEHSGDFVPETHHWNIHPPNSKPWIGLIRDFKGGYQWSDNSPVNFLSWHDGEPNNQDGEDCVELLAYFDKWNDLSCQKQARGYICKTMKSLPSTTAKSSVAETTLQTPTSTQMTASVANNATVSNETESAHLYTQHLGGGEIAGISISIILVIIFVSVAVYFGRRRAKSRRHVRFEDAGIVNALYTPQSEQLL